MKCKKIFLLTILINVMFLLFNVSVKASEIYLSSNDTTSGLKKCIDEFHSDLVNDNGTTWMIDTDDFEEISCHVTTFTENDIYNLKRFTNLKKIDIGHSIFEGSLELDIPLDYVSLYNNSFNYGVNIKSVKELYVTGGPFKDDFTVDEAKTILMEGVSGDVVIIKKFETMKMELPGNIKFLSLSNGKNLSIMDKRSPDELIEELQITNVENVDINKAALSKISFNEIDKLSIEESAFKNNLLLSGNFNTVEIIKNNLKEVEFNELNVTGSLYIEEDLEKISILNNSKILDFQISDTASLEKLFVDSSELPKDFDFSIIPSLKVLSIKNANLDFIDLKNNLNLESLYLSGNNLKGIDLSKNEKLKVLDLSNNKFSTINLKNNKLLTTLNLQSNNWNEKGFAKMENVVKLKDPLKFIELIMLPEGIEISKLNKRFYSSDEYIATVDKDGNIKTLKEGKVDIILEYTLPEVDNKESSKFYEVNSLIITKDGKISNPKTGIDLKYIAMVSLIVIGGVGYLIIRKKIRFPKHN